MVIIATLVALFLLFFFLKRHAGPAHLAMIAGLSVYEMFGSQFVEWITKISDKIPAGLADTGVYVMLILVFPLLLYIRSHHGGMYGILRVAEAAVFAAILTALLSATLAKYLPFDTLSSQISGFISSIEGPLVFAGVIAAYVDVMVYHE